MSHSYNIGGGGGQVYFNSTNPNSASVFDKSNPATTNYPKLVHNVAYQYVGTDQSEWYWDTITSSYIQLVQALPQFSNVTTSIVPQVYQGSAYVPAQANAVANVADVVLLSDGSRIDTGKVTWTAHGLVVGNYYFTSQSVAGGYTNVEPTIGLSQRIFFVLDANTILVNVEPAYSAVTSIAELYNHTSTQWSTTLASTPVNTGTTLNFLTLLTDSNKVTGGTVVRDQYSISANSIVIPYAGKPYLGQRLHHFIRVNFNFVTGPAQDLRIELRRSADNSTIGSSIRASRANDDGGIQTIFESYTNSSADPFVTGGFYIALVNASGTNVAIIGSLGILIQTFYERPTQF